MRLIILISVNTLNNASVQQVYLCSMLTSANDHTSYLQDAKIVKLAITQFY